MDNVSTSSTEDSDDAASVSSAEYYEVEDENNEDPLNDEPFDEDSGGEDDEDLALKLGVDKTIDGEDAAAAGEYHSEEEDDDDDDDDVDEEEEEEDVSVETIGAVVPKPTPNENHPECVIHNTVEVEAMSSVLRNTAGVIVDQFHKTTPFLTKYERAKILGLRVQQLNEGALPLIKMPSSDLDNFEVAMLELQEKRIPFIIRRICPNGIYEYWKIEDLVIL